MHNNIMGSMIKELPPMLATGRLITANQAKLLEDTDEEIDEQELEAHIYMVKIQEVPIVDPGTDTEPLEQWKRVLVDQAWEKPSHDHFRAPTAHDMEILIKTCLMPLALKTQNDSFKFVHELKQEMHADLKELSKPVTTRILPQTARQDVRNTNVIKPGMHRIDTGTTQTRAPQLSQTSRNTDPRVSTSTGVIHRTIVSKPPLKSTQMKDKCHAKQ
ncbi:hypothetical protein Tco_0237446 [Tanacetum coccineum]